MNILRALLIVAWVTWGAASTMPHAHTTHHMADEPVTVHCNRQYGNITLG